MSPPPTVLIPGLLGTPRLYAGQIPALWRYGPVTVADHRHGATMAELAAQVLAVAPPRFALVGLSLGGYIAFEVLRRAPERVARLALLNTTARPDGPERIALRRDQIARAEAGGLADLVPELARTWLPPDRYGDLIGTVTAMAEATGPAAFARQQRAILARPDSRPDLPAIGCPTLVLVGADDRVTPVDRAEEIAAAVPGARLVVVPDCAHLSTVEQPEAVTAALVDWLGPAD